MSSLFRFLTWVPYLSFLFEYLMLVPHLGVSFRFLIWFPYSSTHYGSIIRLLIWVPLEKLLCHLLSSSWRLERFSVMFVATMDGCLFLLLSSISSFTTTIQNLFFIVIFLCFHKKEYITKETSILMSSFGNSIIHF